MPIFSVMERISNYNLQYYNKLNKLPHSYINYLTVIKITTLHFYMESKNSEVPPKFKPIACWLCGGGYNCTHWLRFDPRKLVLPFRQAQVSRSAQDKKAKARAATTVDTTATSVCKK